MSRTSLRHVADRILRERGPAQPLADFIADRREVDRPGGPLSWQAIADEIAEHTDGIVQVTWITVQRWAEAEAA